MPCWKTRAFDCVFVNFVTPFFVDNESIAREIVAVSQQRRKPLVCNLMTDRQQWAEVVKILREGGVPCFPLPGEAARAMAALVQYHAIRSREAASSRPSATSNAGRGRSDHCRQRRPAGRPDSRRQRSTGFWMPTVYPAAEWRVAGNPDEAAAAAEAIGFPVVVKADAASVVHKSDMGGVALNLASASAVKSGVGSRCKRRLPQ
ncbi:MAG: acetate--CoA ligase family protein [Deltaproteobacteria bacterium]|nr:acetate--CoA ligase family protein [Deltaproteobacteria bacterium]